MSEPAVTYRLTKRMQEISALAKLDELTHKWQDEDTKAGRKCNAQVVQIASQRQA